MNLKLAVIAAIIAAAAGTQVPAASRPYEDYAAIVDKQPFGAVPADFDPAVNPGTIDPRAAAGGKAEATPEQEKLQKSVSVSVLHIAPDRAIWVGFTDTTTPKSPRSHYLRVGESADGWEIKSADLAAKKVVLTKQGIDIEVAVGGAGSGTGGAAKVATANEAEPAVARRSPLLDARRADGLQSMASRRAARHQRDDEMRREQAKLAEDLKRSREEMARKQAADDEAREAERAEQREQLTKMAEEMKRLREAQERRREEEAAAAEGEQTE